jgi:hypothetical protein
VVGGDWTRRRLGNQRRGACRIEPGNKTVDLTRNAGDTRRNLLQKTSLDELFCHKTNKKKQRNKSKKSFIVLED